MKKVPAALIVIFALIFSSSIAQVSWKVDKSHSGVGFGLTYMMVNNFEGKFKNFDGKILSPSETDFSNTSVSFMVDTRSVETGDDNRDADLKSKVFFESDKYPKIKFSSTSFKPGKVKGTYDVEGDLTMKGVTKKVKLTAIGAPKVVVNYHTNKTVYGFNITGKIRRGDFGVGNYDLMNDGVVLGEEITLNCNLMLVKLEKVISTANSKKVKLDSKKLDSYVGQYQLSSNIILSVTRIDDHLEAVASGGKNVNDIYAETETTFFWEFADTKIEFLKNDSGRVANFILYKDGMKSAEGKKISDVVHTANNDDLNKKNSNDLSTKEGLVKEAWEELENKNYSRANNLFKDAIKKDENDITLQIGLGHSYLFFGSVPQAVEAYKKCVGKKSEDGKSFDKILQEDFTYFKSRRYPAASMDKVFAELSIQPNEIYENIK